MRKQILKIIEEHGDKGTFVPISLITEVQKEMQELNHKYELNNYQKFLVNEMFSYDLPKVDFDIRSILIVATPSPGIPVVFQQQGRNVPCLLPSSYSDYFSAPRRIEGYLRDLLDCNNNHLEVAHGLPRKYLSAKSGLTKYGRNNICYVDEMGCNINLIPFFTDLDCESEDIYEAKIMDHCESCKLCVNSCPTKAIREEAFLIDNERCLTFMNEAGADNEFPEWVDPSAHNAVVGCTICQEVCPQNKRYMNNIVGPTLFDEEETRLLLKGVREEDLPEMMKEKIVQLDLVGYLPSLPRNLKVLLKEE